MEGTRENLNNGDEMYYYVKVENPAPVRDFATVMGAENAALALVMLRGAVKVWQAAIS